MWAIAQTTAPASSTQKMPSKSDPQGYSADMFDESKVKSDLGHPETYKAAHEPVRQPVPDDLAAIVNQQFGPDFKIATEKSTGGFKYAKPSVDNWVSFLTGDLDGDGVEDAIIVARCSKPLSKQVEFKYSVVDPYFTYYGYGDPKITATLNSEDPSANFIVLIIHGTGPLAWRAPVPKSKYVVVNLPFDSLSMTHIMAKKNKPVVALSLDAIESSGSVIFWDGKKYKWRDVAGAN
jgi:hypothetical protein